MSISLVTRTGVKLRWRSLLSQSLSSTKTSLHRQHNAYSAAPLLTQSSPLEITDEDTLARKTKTKKTVSQLPKRLTLEDGEAAGALPPYDGGLKGPGRTRTKEKEIIYDNVNLVHNNSDNMNIAESNPSRKGRKKRNKPETAAPDNAEKELTSKTRKRKVTTKSQSAVIQETSKEDEEDEVTTAPRRGPRNQLARDILENLANFPQCILLTRVGQFYESYFDQAKEVASLLSIKLTKRTWDGQRVFMAGFPLAQLDKHLKTLVQQHKCSVALCEEFQRARDPLMPISTKPILDRRVVRILTPGTLIDESFLNPFENNYLLAVSTLPGSSEDDVGLAWIDVSTGEFFTHTTQLAALKDYLVRIDPQEVVVDKSLEALQGSPLLDILKECNNFVSYATRPAPGENGYTISPDAGDNIVEDLQTSSNQSVFTSVESIAIELLTDYLRKHLLEHSPSLLQPTRESALKRMQIDAHTLKALEIKEGIREGGTTGSLMSAVKRTVTSSGTRLLARWLCSPSTSIDEIRARHELVDLFCIRPALQADIVEYLRNAEDASRITQRFLLGKGKIDDLASIQHTIEVWGSIIRKLSLEVSLELDDRPWKNLNALLSRVSSLEHLAKRIGSALEAKDSHKRPAVLGEVEEEVAETEEALSSTSESPSKAFNILNTDSSWAIKIDFSPEFTELHDKLRGLLQRKDELERKLQSQYNAPSLTLRISTKNPGMHIHLSKGRRDADRIGKSKQFTLISEKGNVKIYFHQEWSALGNSILETIMAIMAAEKQAFVTLREEVNANSTAIRRNARVFDELDVITSFATLACEMKFVKPTMTESMNLLVVNGRHPTVEQGLLASGRTFTSNTICMDNSSRLQVITGPNMAGKSTFLRQTALIAILAQAGCFVPADRAEIGLVDKVFSRVGAKDDLFRDRSTFMVEMLETGEILRNSTERSLVIMDEVGRGTTTHDGLAIAFATIFHLYYKNRCRALFATHFHEVVDMMGFSEQTIKSDLFPNAGFFYTDVVETEDNHFAYSYRLSPGVNRASHGLKVAKLGRLPQAAIDVAEKALISLKATQQANGNQRQHLVQLGVELIRSDCQGELETF